MLPNQRLGDETRAWALRASSIAFSFAIFTLASFFRALLQMSGLARLSLQQLVRAAARPTLASTPPIASTSTLVLRPLQSARRTLTISAVLAAKGQGGREVKAKKSPKGKENFVKGGKGKSKAVEEDEDDGDDNWNSGGSSGGGKKAPRRTTEPNEADVIEAEVAKADDKMSKAVGWFSDKYGENVARVRGQVSTGASHYSPCCRSLESRPSRTERALDKRNLYGLYAQAG